MCICPHSCTYTVYLHLSICVYSVIIAIDLKFDIKFNSLIVSFIVFYVIHTESFPGFGFFFI